MMKWTYSKPIATTLGFSFVAGCTASLSPTAVDPGNEFLDMDIAQLMLITITSVAKKPQNLS